MKESLHQNSPKKVLYLITKANWGGAQRYVFDLAIAAKDAGHTVAVAYGSGGGLAERLVQNGIRTFPLPALEREIHLGADIKTFREILSLLKRERPHTFHINSSKAGGLGALAARIAKVPNIIFTAHGWAFNEDRPWWQKIIIFKLHALTVMLSHKTICVSEAMRRDMQWVPFVGRKLVVIKNGVREPLYKTHDEARATLWPSQRAPLWIGMISELHETKRIDDAISAIAMLRKTHPEAVLVVLGEGEEREHLTRMLREQKLETVVHLAGFVPEGSSYLHAFDFFLHSSRTEALAYAVIEAGYASLPVVATNVGGLPEIVEDKKSGLLVPPLRPDLLAHAVRELIENPERAHAFDTALRARVIKIFSIERMIKETLVLY